MVPVKRLPFAVFGSFQEHVAIPLTSECVAATRVPATVPVQAIVALAIGPPVSLSDTPRLAEKRAPGFAGLGAVVNAVCRRVSVVRTL